MKVEKRILRYLDRLYEEENHVKDFYLTKLMDCKREDEDYYNHFLSQSSEKLYLLKDIIENIKDMLEME